MASSILSSLTAISVPASGDLLYIVDVSDSTDSASGSSRQITYGNLISGLATSGANSSITSLTGLTTPLTVAQGGSGAATLTGILKGNGTSAFTAVTAPSGTIVGTTDTQTLTNKTLTTPIIATISNTGTLTLPTSTDTLVGKATTDTLTNKTLTSPTINTPTFSAGAVTTTAILDANVTNRKIKMDELQVDTITSFSTGSTTYVDLTNLTITFTPNVACNFLVLLSAALYNATAGAQMKLIVQVDGVTKGDDPLIHNDAAASNAATSVSNFLWITGITAASHTITVQGKTSSGTLVLNQATLIVIPFAS